MDDIQERLGHVGLTPWLAVELHGFISDGGRFVHAVEVPAETCVTLVALATRGVGDMDAALYSADGDMLAADSQPDSHPAIQVCGGAAAAPLYYVLHAYEGAGSFLMRAFEGPRAAFAGTATELGGAPAIALRPRAEVSVQDEMDTLALGLSRRGFVPLRLPRRTRLDANQRVRQALPVQSGQCYSAAAFGLDGLTAVGLRVYDDQGGEVATDQGLRSVAQVQFCASKSAQFSAETHAARGNGQVAMLLYHGRAHRVLAGPGLWLGRGSGLGNAGTSTDGASAKTYVATRVPRGQGRVVGSGQLGPGQAVEHELQIASAGCHALEVVAVPTLPKVALSVLDHDGHFRPLSDGLVCGDVPRPVVLRIVAPRGYGAYSVTVRRTAGRR